MYQKKNYKIFYQKKLSLLEDLKMPQEFHTLLNFNFTMIYIIHKILLLLINRLNYLKK